MLIAHFWEMKKSLTDTLRAHPRVREITEREREDRNIEETYTGVHEVTTCLWRRTREASDEGGRGRTC